MSDLKCPIQLKVRFTDGTLGVRLLRVSDSTVRIGLARGEGSGLEGLAPPCGQLTRCFSAVAELLVFLFFSCHLLTFSSHSPVFHSGPTVSQFTYHLLCFTFFNFL